MPLAIQTYRNKAFAHLCVSLLSLADLLAGEVSGPAGTRGVHLVGRNKTLFAALMVGWMERVMSRESG